MKSFFGFLSVVVVCLGGVACADVDEPTGAPADDEAVAEDELVTGRVKSIEVNRSTGFVPPSPAGQCRRAGAWTFNFETRSLSGNACLSSTPVAIDKVLSEEEAGRVRTALSKVRVTARPQACPTDMPTSSLQVFRAQSQAGYIDARASCNSASTPVRESTLEGLVALLEELSAPTTDAAPCVRSGCSGEICSDQPRFSACVFRPEFACYRSATCERGADGQCGFRQTPALTTCLGNTDAH